MSTARSKSAATRFSFRMVMPRPKFVLTGLTTIAWFWNRSQESLASSALAKSLPPGVEMPCSARMSFVTFLFSMARMLL